MSKRTDLTQLQALLAYTRDKNHEYLLNTEECSSIRRGTSWEQNADNLTLLPNYSLTLIEVQNGEVRRIPATLLSTSILSLS